MQYTIGSFVLIATVTVTLGGAAKLYLGGVDGETTGRIASALGAEGPATAAGDGGDDAGDVGFDLSAAADMLPGFEPESVLAVGGLAGVPGIPTFGKKGDSPFGALPVSKRDKRDRRDRDMPPGDRPRGDPNDPNCTGTSCNKPGKECFGAGTLVVTADGLVPIESLGLGDLVLTRSTPDQPLVERAITLVHETPGKPILEITIQEEGGAPELIEVTPHHPFWVADEGWVHSDQLAPGDELSTADGDAASVLSVASTDRTETVYNLTIDEHHTYFVGATGTWVHNVDDCGRKRPRDEDDEDDIAPPPKQPKPNPEPSKFRNSKKLRNHFLKHKDEWNPPLTKEQYVQKAKDLLAAPVGGDIEEDIRPNGDIRRRNKRTGEYAVMDKDGTILTFYKPEDSDGNWAKNTDKPDQG